MTNNQFALLGYEEVRKNDRKFWFIFIILIFVTYWSFKMPISMMIAFVFVIITMMSALLYAHFRYSKPTHIQIDGSTIRAKRYNRLLWSAKVSDLGYEATDYHGELNRTFFIYNNGLLTGKFSFINYGMSQYKVFLEMLASLLKKDVELFYKETYGKEIPIRSLSEKNLIEANPKSYKKRSSVYLLFRSLISLITTKNPNNESLGIYKKSVQYARATFWLSSIFLIVQVWFLISYHRPFYITQFPAEHSFLLNQGMLTEVHKRKTPTSLLLTTVDGQQIPFDYTYKVHEVLDSNSSKQVYASVWWFPLNGSSLGWIGKMEINGTQVITVEEQKKAFAHKLEFYFQELYSIYLFALVVFLAWMWEFRIQYRINRQLAL